ncbi:MAG TPA: ferrous iron transport protein B [Pseudomonadales bacterium]
MTTVALVGNPNCGKTTLFNALTGTRQRVGNWPGVTVERKTGSYSHGDGSVDVVDLPGTYSVHPVGDAVDERIAREFISAAEPSGPDVVVNVVDASSLARGLYLTTELLQMGKPVVVALNMIDVADRNGMHIDTFQLARELGCPVVALVASRGDGVGALKDAVESREGAGPASALPPMSEPDERFHYVDGLITRCVKATPTRRSVTDRIDAVVLHRYLAYPIFLGVMYLMFMFAINVGSAFIDLFDGVGNVLFVEGPRRAMLAVGLPEWLVVFAADGVGGGIQLVGTFIPVIGCLFLALSFLEDSGYMGRVAFIVDRLMRRLGLPGKSFVPLIVGFGCNVPAVMATRTLDNEPDRILTTIMAPYMSCGARLTVYALFAAAFFPTGGQNVVFALYLIGIVVAVLSGLAVRRYLISDSRSTFLLELPTYHLPTMKGLLLQTWQRLKGFVLRAGKAIVAVVIVLNVVGSVGTDGSFGNQNTEKSVLSALGRTITPIFHPMGISQENWPATVGIFTGIFAKEVVVGTLDALYAPGEVASADDLAGQLRAAAASVPANLAELGEQLTDPLGIGLGALDDVAEAASDQEVEINTIQAMRELFHGKLGAFSYLLFILLYMPCVATIGAIFKEIGGFWAAFSTSWSVTVAYSAAVICYQLGNLAEQPGPAMLWIAGVAAATVAAFAGLVAMGRRRRQRLIPLVNLE